MTNIVYGNIPEDKNTDNEVLIIANLLGELVFKDIFTNAKELGIHAVEIADKEEGDRTCGIKEEQIASCEV